jgi:DNA helicase-2/ATP-dependent DNA helicase PcrA
MTRLPLTASFRWRTDEQRELAGALRRQAGVVLIDAEGDDDVEVVLASQWSHVWEVGNHVLPLAYGSAKGNAPESAATLLLNQLTRTVLGESATYLADALRTLKITDLDAPDRLEASLQDVLERLQVPGKPALNDAYDALVQAVQQESPRPFPKAHGAYTKRLDALRGRLARGKRLIPGMTIHQAKGREWDSVGVRLSEQQRAALADGLQPERETHRQLYVACTRARYRTRAV